MMHRSLMRTGTALTKRTAPRPSSGVRHFRKSAPTKYTENKELTGLAGIVEDYVPKNVRTLARLGWLGATSLMFLGLLRVNLEGPGITEVVKTVWRESPNKKKLEA
ncbi:hypothetical protein AM588_10005607 [Phytophthora nicotianae]|uniref:Uncharacterized protein n=1 Tax=Phytophthora nicotianae TaxID=4792 RepID=A0A0W8D0S1_PHYNI|nr:hypothetical protein AM588_10005607 [Phytophthora nicotianae]